MANTTNALALRNAAKRKKYTFIVKESKFSSGVKKRWRLPRGKHSKVRQMHKGRPQMPQPGFGSPASVRGLHRSGLQEVVVARIEDIAGLDPKVHGVVISRTLGNKKRLEVLKAVSDAKLSLLNVKDVTKAAEKITQDFAARKKKRLERIRSKQKKAKKETEKEAKKDKKNDLAKADKKVDEKKQETKQDTKKESKVEEKSIVSETKPEATTQTIGKTE